MIPTQLSTLHLKMKSCLSGGKPLYLLVWLALLASMETHSFLPGHCFYVICANMVAADPRLRSQQMALRSCICSRNRFGKVFCSRKALLRNESLASLKMVLVLVFPGDLQPHHLPLSGTIGFCSPLLKISLCFC